MASCLDIKILDIFVFSIGPYEFCNYLYSQDFSSIGQFNIELRRFFRGSHIGVKTLNHPINIFFYRIICVFKSSSRIGHNFDGVLFRVIDCTGDADIAYMAGAEYRKTGELTFVERNKKIK